MPTRRVSAGACLDDTHEYAMAIDKREFVGWDVAAPVPAVMPQIGLALNPDEIFSAGENRPVA